MICDSRHFIPGLHLMACDLKFQISDLKFKIEASSETFAARVSLFEISNLKFELLNARGFRGAGILPADLGSARRQPSGETTKSLRDAGDRGPARTFSPNFSLLWKKQLK
jgi:hypothetical protein